MSDSISQEEVDLVSKFEGYSHLPYQDPAGVWTIGFGSIWNYDNVPPTRVTAGTTPIDDDIASKWLMLELLSAHRQVDTVVHVVLTNRQHEALDDFVYNLGIGNFKTSTLLVKLNKKDWKGAAAEFDKWDHAGGKELAGLLRRRQTETDLFTSGTGGA